MNKDKTWKEIPIGGLIITPGSSEKYLTGDWRTFRPIRDKKKCIDCMICWLNCPDSSISSNKGTFGKFDYDHCKGCGICANQCPTKAIDMKPEVDFNE